MYVAYACVQLGVWITCMLGDLPIPWLNHAVCRTSKVVRRIFHGLTTWLAVDQAFHQWVQARPRRLEGLNGPQGRRHTLFAGIP